jgi:hypothetical protein
VAARAPAPSGAASSSNARAFRGSLSRLGTDYMDGDGDGAAAAGMYHANGLDHRHHEFGGKINLAQSALQRFDRLRDRLQGLMLNTIDGYLEEITALSETVSNTLNLRC